MDFDLICNFLTEKIGKDIEKYESMKMNKFVENSLNISQFYLKLNHSFTEPNIMSFIDRSDNHISIALILKNFKQT